MRIVRNITRVLGGAVWLSLTLAAQTFTTLYNFGAQSHDGIFPRAGVVAGPQGEFYGITSNGGEFNLGTVYELLPPAAPGGAWTEVVLHSFNGQDGAVPTLGLLLGPRGALYGVTSGSTGGNGTAFELDPPTGGSTHWPFTLLYQFPTLMGGPPSGSLVFGMGGALYGTTGAGAGQFGTIYCLTPPSGSGGASALWTQQTLYSFPGGTVGSAPIGPLAVSSNGTLFGMTKGGGDGGGRNFGTVFLLRPPTVSGGQWTEVTPYWFDPQKSGYYPVAGLVFAPTGVLYGTLPSGALDGVVFSLAPPAVPGGLMIYTTIYAFGRSDITGAHPVTGVVRGPDGVLYGTTFGYGTVFKLAPPTSTGGSWIENVLHSFTGGADGATPNGLALGADGTLYGTTQVGGFAGSGTVFALTP